MLISFNLIASPVVKGYKDNFYELKPDNTVCEYNSRYSKNWCIPIQKSAIGLYLGFKQLIVFSKTSIQAINLTRREIKWTIPLRNVYKLHINYPVIITFGQDRTLTGYDFFSGYQLWKKSTDYNGLYESGVDLWMVSNKGIDKLDVVTAESVQTILFKRNVTDIHGDELFLYIQFGKNLYHYNLLNKTLFKVGNQFRVIDKASNIVLVGNNQEQQLRTFSNEIISENIQHDIFKVNTPTKTFFTYLFDDKLSFITKKGATVYQFTRTKNNDNILYGYRLNDKIRVFHKDGQDVWTLNQIKKKQSDQDI